MDRTWTEAQLEAISTVDRDVCVAAGAGSGKTGVLVERFVRIVHGSLNGSLPPERRAGVGQILVITFTDKATREMKSRIVERLEQEGLREQRREVETAYISTIHGFCSRLLKENPFDAGVDPQFHVLDETDSRRLLYSAFEGVVERAYDVEDEEITELVAAAQDERVFGTDAADPLAALEAAVRTVLNRLRGAGWRAEAATETWERWRTLDACGAAGHHAPVVALVNRVGKELWAARKPLAHMKQGLLGALEAVRGDVAARIHEVAPLDVAAPWERIAAAISALQEIGKAAARGARARSNASPAEIQVQEALRAVQACAQQAKALFDLTLEREQEAERLASRFRRLLLQTWEAYDDAKRRAGVLDQEDLQLEAVHLLETCPAVLRRCRARFRYIMVDEFQDTNPLQMRLVDLLHTGLASNQSSRLRHGFEQAREDSKKRSAHEEASQTAHAEPGSPHPPIPSPDNGRGGDNADAAALVPPLGGQGASGPATRLPNTGHRTPSCNLFVVGDAQQSIYGFRHADARIFEAMERRFRSADGTNGAGAHVTLAANFRARPEILRFINYLFDAIWRAGATRFTALEPGATHAPKAGPSVEFLVTRDAGKALYTSVEARALAARIRRMVDSHEVPITECSHPRAGQPVGYGDVAVLLRGLTQIEQYERAFTEAGVPYFVVGGGRGYYARHEVRDLMNVLTVIDNPLDDVALTAVLRSPMVGVDTDTLYSLARHAHRAHDTAPLYPAILPLCESGELPEGEREALLRFHALIEELLRVENRLPLGRLLEEIVIRTQYDARLLVRSNGRRRLANVRKLLQMANAASQGQWHGVGDFIRRLREIERISDREGDAPTEEEQADVVRIMTIHKAKGLEFPVVFVADMGRGTPPGGSALFLADPASLAIGCKLGDYQTAAYRAIEEARRQREHEETNRVLYVALTRAREHLVLCGPTQARSKEAWSTVVFGHTGITMPQAASETRMGPAGVALTVTQMSALGGCELS